MRIIAGKFKGKKLFGFDGDSIRPTSDKAREALFAILYNINGYNFLDLFCGTGAMGLEAESRGATVTMVDISKKSIDLTQKNANAVRSNSKIICQNALDFLQTTTSTFNVIFADPPYEMEIGDKLIKIIKDRKLLSTGGVFIFEKNEPTDYSYLNLQKVKERKYGKNVFTFYEEV